MRIKFWALSVLMVGLALLIGLVPGRTQNPPEPSADRERGKQNPAAPPADPEFGERTQLSDSQAPRPIAPPSWIDKRFQQLDRNGDGYLSVDEMTENLKVEKDRWDVNGDGLIDLAEWRGYVTAFSAKQRRSPADQETHTPQRSRKPRSEDLGREPHVQPAVPDPHVPAAVRPPFVKWSPRKEPELAASIFPRNIPDWFKEYDADGDGMISLDEWKAKEDSLREFRKYDLNGDGFISLFELVRSGQFLTGYNSPPVLVGTNPEVGQFYYWQVTGTSQGAVFGTDIYTIDSPMGAVAVHAGLLREGQTAFLKVILLPGQLHYYGSSANGITSQDRHTGYHKSFRVETIR